MSKYIKIDDIVNDERTEYFKSLIPSDLIRGDSRLIGSVDEDGYPEGMLLYRVSGFIIDILHIEVYEELRGLGIGSDLIDVLLTYISDAGMPFVIQAVYGVGEDFEDGEAAHAFFESIEDFEVVSGGKYCTVTSHTLWNSKRLKLLSDFDCSIKSYTELTKKESKKLLAYLAEKNMSLFIAGDDESIIPELSLCHVENGDCTTLALFKNTGIKKCVELSFLMSKPGEEDNLSGVLKVVIERLKIMYPHHDLIFSVVNKESVNVSKRFFTKDLKVSELYTAVSFGKIG